jgi:rhomboid protease GluP
MRQTSGAIVCPNCGRLIGVTERACPFCGAWRPGFYGWMPGLRKLFAGRLDFVSLIITAAVALYVIALLLQPDAIASRGGLLSFLSPGMRALYQLGMTGGIAWQEGWWWTLFTAILLHGSILHIFFNVLWIRDLGPVVTDIYGPARAFVLFEAAGVGGFLISNIVTGTPTIGASGSIFGLLGALIAYGRRHGSSTLSTQLWQWAIVLFIMGFLLPGVNNWAHAGGFATGWACAMVMHPEAHRREGTVTMLLALGCVGMTALGVVLSFTKVTSILLR